MSTAGLINRYVFFVTTIYNRGPISLEEIQRHYESRFGRGEELSERQFHRYTDAVEEFRNSPAAQGVPISRRPSGC